MACRQRGTTASISAWIPADGRLLERAAEVSNLSVSAFVLQSAVARAAEVLAERPLIELGPRSAGALTEAFLAPATVKPPSRRSAVSAPWLRLARLTL